MRIISHMTWGLKKYDLKLSTCLQVSLSAPQTMEAVNTIVTTMREDMNVLVITAFSSATTDTPAKVPCGNTSFILSILLHFLTCLLDSIICHLLVMYSFNDLLFIFHLYTLTYLWFIFISLFIYLFIYLCWRASEETIICYTSIIPEALIGWYVSLMESCTDR